MKGRGRTWAIGGCWHKSKHDDILAVSYTVVCTFNCQVGMTKNHLKELSTLDWALGVSEWIILMKSADV